MKINLEHPELEDFLPEARTDSEKLARIRGWLSEEIMTDMRVVAPAAMGLISRVDVVAAGTGGQVTPLLTRDGVVVRLDLGAQERCPEPENSAGLERLRSLIMHEMYHLADRLDADFAMDYHMDATVLAGRLRREVNALWDVYIERRKLKMHAVKPLVWFSRDQNPKDSVLDNLKEVVGAEPESSNIFNLIWDSEQPVTHEQLIAWAKKIIESRLAAVTVQDFLMSPRHILRGAESKTRDALRWLLDRLPDDVRRKILRSCPPIAVISAGAELLAKRLTDACPRGLIIISVPMHLEMNSSVSMRGLAARLAHEFGHVYHKHFGMEFRQRQEYEADKAVVEWSLGELLLVELEREVENPREFYTEAYLEQLKPRVLRLREVLAARGTR